MRYFKVLESALFHQPLQIGRGNSLFSMERSTVDGSFRLFSNIVSRERGLSWIVKIPVEIIRNLLQCQRRQVAFFDSWLTFLNAITEIIICITTLFLSTAFQDDKTRVTACEYAGLQVFFRHIFDAFLRKQKVSFCSFKFASNKRANVSLVDGLPLGTKNHTIGFSLAIFRTQTDQATMKILAFGACRILKDAFGRSNGCHHFSIASPPLIQSDSFRRPNESLSIFNRRVNVFGTQF